jgi:hypothetical protein
MQYGFPVGSLAVREFSQMYFWSMLEAVSTNMSGDIISSPTLVVCQCWGEVSHLSSLNRFQKFTLQKPSKSSLNRKTKNLIHLMVDWQLLVPNRCFSVSNPLQSIIVLLLVCND